MVLKWKIHGRGTHHYKPGELFFEWKTSEEHFILHLRLGVQLGTPILGHLVFQFDVLAFLTTF